MESLFKATTSLDPSPPHKDLTSTTTSDHNNKPSPKNPRAKFLFAEEEQHHDGGGGKAKKRKKSTVSIKNSKNGNEEDDDFDFDNMEVSAMNFDKSSIIRQGALNGDNFYDDDDNENENDDTTTKPKTSNLNSVFSKLNSAEEKRRIASSAAHHHDGDTDSDDDDPLPSSDEDNEDSKNDEPLAYLQSPNANSLSKSAFTSSQTPNLVFGAGGQDSSLDGFLFGDKSGGGGGSSGGFISSRKNTIVPGNDASLQELFDEADHEVEYGEDNFVKLLEQQDREEKQRKLEEEQRKAKLTDPSSHLVEQAMKKLRTGENMYMMRGGHCSGLFGESAKKKTSFNKKDSSSNNNSSDKNSAQNSTSTRPLFHQMSVNVYSSSDDDESDDNDGTELDDKQKFEKSVMKQSIRHQKEGINAAVAVTVAVSQHEIAQSLLNQLMEFESRCRGQIVTSQLENIEIVRWCFQIVKKNSSSVVDAPSKTTSACSFPSNNKPKPNMAASTMKKSIIKKK